MKIRSDMRKVLLSLMGKLISTQKAWLTFVQKVNFRIN